MDSVQVLHLWQRLLFPYYVKDQDMSNFRKNMLAEEVSLKTVIVKARDWTKFLFSKWKVLLLLGILGASIGFFYAKTKKTIYTATTTFVLDAGGESGGLGQYAGIASVLGVDIGGSGNGNIFQGDNLIELYRSRKMIQAALLAKSNSDSSKLILDYYFELNKTREKWKKQSPDLLNINFIDNNRSQYKRQKDSILQNLIIDINKSNLFVGKLDKNASIFKVDVKSQHEVFSKEFNEELVKEVNDFYIQTKTKKSLNNIAILQDKTDSVKNVMNGDIVRVASIADATPNLNPTRQAQRMVPTQKSQFSAETNKAILSQLIQNLELSKMTLMKEAPLIQKLDEPLYPLETENASKIMFTGMGGFIFVFLGSIYFIVLYVLRDISK